MNFSEIFKSSFLEGFNSPDISPQNAVFMLLVTTFVSLYIFFFYRAITKKTFYSISFNISLVGTAIITAAIVFTIQSSVVVSLGMVGALSIVRYRTAIKEPIDLMFLFWAVSTGIICGAGLAEIAIITAIFMSVILLLLSKVPLLYKPQILVINCSNNVELQHFIKEVIHKNCRSYCIKSRCVTRGELEMVIELRSQHDDKLVEELTSNEAINTVSLLVQDGEATY
jgi:uncharacterized membrane protein YhiD involved in acid resistance